MVIMNIFAKLVTDGKQRRGKADDTDYQSDYFHWFSPPFRPDRAYSFCRFPGSGYQIGGSQSLRRGLTAYRYWQHLSQIISRTNQRFNIEIYDSTETIYPFVR